MYVVLNGWFFPRNLIRGKGCPECRRKMHLNGNTVDFSEASLRVHNASNGNLDIVADVDKYFGLSQKTLCRCNKCGRTFYMKPESIILNKTQGCVECGRKTTALKRTRSNKDFLEQLKEVNPYIAPLERYRSESEHIKCKCLKCGHIWNTTPGGLLSHKNGCPICNISHGERDIENYLRNKHIKFEQQKEFNGLYGCKGGLLKFDFYLPEYNIAIEYNGEFHDNSNQTHRVNL